MEVNIYKLQLELLKRSIIFINIERLLRPIKYAIDEAKNNIDKAKNTGDKDYYNMTVDDESDAVESLVGVAFVICQTYITAIISRIKKLHESLKMSTPDVNLTTTDAKKDSIIYFGDDIVNNTPYTRVQIIDAMSNYFKHKDEWSLPWDRITDRRTLKTIEVISSVGAKEGSTGNFRQGLKSLGINDYNVLKLIYILNKWRKELHDAYQSEFKSCSLI